MTQDIPSDAELDATVARIEPRLFMTLGARSRRRRWARAIGGTAAAAALIGGGLAIGAYLLPAAPGSAVDSVTSASTTNPSISSAIACHDGAGKVVARIQLATASEDPAKLCVAVGAPGVSAGPREPSFAPDSGIPVTCAGAHGIADVYLSKSGDAASTCASLHTYPYRDGK